MIQIDLTGICGISLDYEESQRILQLNLNLRESSVQVFLSASNPSVADVLLEIFQSWSKTQ